ncbi:MAG TPA: Rieske 2Fe-2S domain-containing protein [Acidimicrobiia bacterium]|jgi:ubiquinol-cytochrome c reductase iron-sulfur subunit|nr:ubiquinol-cytochrome c reductase iron-sulfur subunit [Actinomycetota bacterium]MDQ1501075.1 ubiquinol-cytochrome c reductase iron-sulfur subunit [Actinomycetota bacterium]MDQ1507585.1 ubiquinol-cytochrome c reductase iron-sulfur subunit [Actinomycetota bacterium]HEV7861416.1 Rieske 2Fe-2S domain-containing protein [Acidimicrobiia bacterium]
MAEPDGDRRAETLAAVSFGLATVAALALVVVFWRGGQPQAEGLLLGVVTGGLGVGIVLWARLATPQDDVTEERHLAGSTEEQVSALASDFGAGGAAFGRRRLLVGLLASAGAAFGAALVFPIRSLGPRPGKGFKRTAYGDGRVRLVTADGRPVLVDDLPLDGVVTVWPEGHTGDGDAPTLLIRTRPDQTLRPRPGRRDWTIEGVVAYSKLCTHVGCPVGLYQAAAGLLLCPCHQSTFDVLDGARPVFGPAARSLPQLPLGRNAQGELIALGDFSGPVGPGFWDRDR